MKKIYFYFLTLLVYVLFTGCSNTVSGSVYRDTYLTKRERDSLSKDLIQSSHIDYRNDNIERRDREPDHDDYTRRLRMYSMNVWYHPLYDWRYYDPCYGFYYRDIIFVYPYYYHYYYHYYDYSQPSHRPVVNYPRQSTVQSNTTYVSPSRNRIVSSPRSVSTPVYNRNTIRR